MPKRRRLATGIYEDAYGRSVIYSLHGKPVETRFEVDRPLDFLQRWRKRQIATALELAPRDPRGSLARDCVRYLKRLKGTVGYKAAKSHLKAWLHYFGRSKRRWQITTEDIDLAIAQWRRDGKSAGTIRHRCRLLQAVYRALDGLGAACPVAAAKRPPKPRGRAVTVSDTVIADVAAKLKRQEHPTVNRLRDSKTRARFLVLASTGRRPAEVMRAEPGDVDLVRRVWFVRAAKGGRHTTLALNDEMVAAWQLFATADAWGTYDSRSFVKTLQRNGWPTHVRPYNLRHTTAVAIRARGGDLEDVQDQLGHASLETAREFYLHAIPARQAQIAASLDGRFDAEVFRAHPPTPLTAAQQRRKDRRARRTPTTDSHDRSGTAGETARIGEDSEGRPRAASSSTDHGAPKK